MTNPERERIERIERLVLLQLAYGPNPGYERSWRERVDDLIGKIEVARCQERSGGVEQMLPSVAPAQRDGLQQENDTLRAIIAKGPMDCVYCGLPATDMSKCASGFPGCARADDMLGDPRPAMPPPVAPAQTEATFPQPSRNDGGVPCGECHLRAGETCDVCGAEQSGGGADAAASRPSLAAQAEAVELADQRTNIGEMEEDAGALSAAAETLRQCWGWWRT